MHLTFGGWIPWLWFVKCLFHLSTQTQQQYSEMWSWSTFTVHCNFREAAKSFISFICCIHHFFKARKVI